MLLLLGIGMESGSVGRLLSHKEVVPFGIRLRYNPHILAAKWPI